MDEKKIEELKDAFAAHATASNALTAADPSERKHVVGAVFASEVRLMDCAHHLGLLPDDLYIKYYAALEVARRERGDDLAFASAVYSALTAACQSASLPTKEDER